ncbi:MULTISPECIES: BTAD domain-containing putative transcriptional regulator [Nocardiaceae]|uniref:AAA family ATPase n=1 Tax=Rhodococcoides kroppenstedtii TaxID=293050 RepID=A0ABS7NRR2_9NOCA|nr:MULTISPECIES: BTAD domain-containing putative transcriptional regulator [Rhodococcus]AMY19450.1 Transcriptional regulatory protein EmbR [Rhodococcus sp. PBTS 1]MBY6312638.1 AAA family ATPase [Rhodococcus kroppenstedtii]MBY6320694.1 AAA family ATPase [Rhodococcus kroppenstedtii]MBY6399395.1 AAA family ATPase [Rhodococcus kroppenstedtii]
MATLHPDALGDTGSGPVTVSVLGPLVVTVGGREVSAGSRRQRALLQRLVIGGSDVVPVDTLIGDLWTAPPPRALAALQVHVSNLRRILEPHRPARGRPRVLVGASPGYGLILPEDAVDTRRVDGALIRARTAADAADARRILADALGHWRGAAYAEVRDFPWATAEAARLDDLRLVARELHAACGLRLADHAAVVAELTGIVRDRPDREESVRLLATALYRSGRQLDALDVLARSRRHLADEFGVDPAPRLRSLESDILAHRDVDVPTLPPDWQEPSTTPVATVRVPRSRPSAEPAVDARPAESARLREVLTRTRVQSRATTIWVTGEAGDGKTTLAGRAADEVRAHGTTVATGRCSEVPGAPPGWPWERIEQELAGQDPAAPQDPTATRVPTRSAFERAHHLEELCERNLAGGGALVLVLDDLHRADETTVHVLRHLVAAFWDRPLAVVATYRPSEVTPTLLPALAPGRHRSDTVALAGVGSEGVRAVARAVGVVLSQDVADRIARRSGGNPLFARELARLVGSHGPRQADVAVPDGIDAVLRARLARLPENTTVLLRRAAVLGRDVDLDVLADITDEEDWLDALEPAIVDGVLEDVAPTRVRFSHTLFRDVLYADQPRLRRARVHARVAAALRRRPQPETTAVAHHALASATAATAAESVALALAAARDADEAGAWSTSLDLRRRAREVAETADPPDPALLHDVLVPLIGSAARAGDATGARRLRREAIELADRLGRSPFAAATGWTAPPVWSLRDSAEPDRPMIAVLDRLLDETVDPGDRARLHAAAFFEWEGLDDAAAERHAVSAVREADRSGDPEAVCRALGAFGYLAYGPDHDDAREPAARRLLAVAADRERGDHVAVAYFQLFLAACARADLVAARAELDRALAAAAGTQLLELVGVAELFDALVHALAGDVDEAVRRYDALSRDMAEQGLSLASVFGLISRVMRAQATGVVDDDLWQRTRRAANDTWFPVEVPTAFVHLLAGDRGTAAALYRRSPRPARDYAWRAWTVMRAHLAAAAADLEECRLVYDALLPFTGTFGGLDAGSFSVGTVDAALAATAAALGRDDDAAVHRRRAEETEDRVRHAARALLTARTPPVPDGGAATPSP